MYGLRHSKVHPAALSLMQQGGYDDILLVDAEGRVVYSALKGSEFTRNVSDAELSASGLAKMYESLKASQGGVVFQDFAASSLASGAPAAFIGAPIMRRANVAMGGAQEEVRAGYAIIRLSPSVIDRVFSDRHGLGETGETVAVGKDGLLENQCAAFKDADGRKARERTWFLLRQGCRQGGA